MDIFDRIRLEERWLYEAYEDDLSGNTMYRIYGEDDDSVEGTICEVWTDEETCKEICDAHNRVADSLNNPEILVLEPSGFELRIEKRTDGKWYCLDAKHGS